MSAKTRGESIRHLPVTLVTLALVIIAGAARAQTFRISGVRIAPDGRIVLQHTADTNSYYILLRGDQVTAIFTARDMQFGIVGTNQLKDPNLATNAGFYRIREVPLSNALDTDGDGIDDVCEIKYRPLLDPLNANDANLDPDDDGRTTLEECGQGRNPFVADLPEVATISYPTNATTASFVIFSGVATTNTLIRVEGGAAYVTNAVGAGGAFDVTVALNPNRLNRLFVSAVDEFGNVSAPVPIDILQDSVAPYLFIDFPTNGSVLTASNTMVAGRVGDALSGFLGLSVTVNGVAANVDVGIGPNGTYQRGGVPLNVGTNQLTVVASDRLGNSITKNVTIVREEPAGPRLLAISGDLQQTNILRRLGEPLVVKVTEAGGSPRANQLVNLQVTRSDGRLLPVNTNQLAADITTRPDYSSNGTILLQLFTDANGEARAWWTTGMDAGHANNRVTVSASNIQETVFFCASAIALPAKQINIGSGNNQRGETFGHAPEPLKVWVSDGNNPVAGVPVTFRVVHGGGELVPIVAADGASPAGPGLRGSRPTGSITLSKARTKQGVSEVTVLTSITGHAEVDFIFGPESGNQTVEATFAGNAGLPATFTARVLARVPGQPTSFTGLIQDNAMQPIGRAWCELTVAGATLTTFSDPQGRFAFGDIPSGSGHLFVDGNTANTLGTNSIPTNSFPPLQYTIAVVPNAENSLPTPVLLPRLNTNNARWYYGTNDLVVTCEGIAGLQMTIKANSMKHPGGEIVSPGRPAFVSLNQVHHDDIPMPMPDGASPPFAWTLQPGGATFDPPVQVAYPNMSGLAPGAAAFFLTFNHDTERFEIVASGHVVEDGSTIVCDSGAGLTISGWGCNCPPYSVTADVEQCVEAEAKPTLFKTPEAKAEDATSGSNVRFIDNLPPISLASLLDPYCGLTTFNHVAVTHVDCRSDGLFIVSLNWKVEVTSRLVWDQILEPEDIEFVTQHEMRHTVNWRNQVERLKAQYQAYDGVTFPSRAAAQAVVNQFNDDITLAVELAYDTDNNTIDNDADSERCFDMRVEYGGILPNLATRAKGEPPCCVHDVIAVKLPPDSWTYTVNGQSVTTSSDRSFRIANVSAPDQFGAGGPGTARDFVSDDFVRVTAIGVVDGTNRYAFSDYFRLRQAQAVSIDNLTFTDTPARKPESITILPQSEAMTAIGQTNQLRVIAKYADGGTNDVTPKTSWTSYRVSNPNIATVDENGVVKQQGKGLVYVTAVNEGVTAVARLLVSPDGNLITITGTVLDTNGVPVSGATVAIFSLDVRVQTDASGRFSLQQVPTTFGSLVITVEWFQGNSRFLTVVRDPPLSSGAVTDLGNILLLPFKPEIKPRLAAGVSHTLAMRSDGTLWAWGNNSNGQLGDDTTEMRLSPVQIGTNVNWQSVAAGNSHTLALRNDGTLWAWGDNSNGQLGDGTTQTRLSPVQIGTNANWQSVVTGQAHTMALRNDGTLWAWGYNEFGQLGDGTNVQRLSPVQVGTNTDWQSVAAGYLYTTALRSDGTLWAWGYNSNGRLGDGTTVNRYTPVQVGTNAGWQAVAASQHTLALRSDGTLWAWGRNGDGELGDGTKVNRLSPVRVGTNATWKAVAAGGRHTLAVQSDGTVWAWGADGDGQLGVGTDDGGDQLSPVLVGTDTEWPTIVAGDEYTLALRSDGTLLAWGRNGNGQLGNGSVGENRFRPALVGSNTNWQTVVAGTFHTLALQSNGTLWAWGDNRVGQSGDGTTEDHRNPVQVGTNANWRSIAAGLLHSIALRNDGTLWAWGFNERGELGDGTTTNRLRPVQIGTNTDWQSIATGDEHTIAVRSNGTLWVWGSNEYGQIGDGTTTNRLTPVQIGTNTDWHAVAGGNYHTLALRTDRTLWAWGLNDSGMLGDGTTENRFDPVQIGTNANWQFIAAGSYHSLAVQTNGTLWGWGYNANGQLGDGQPSGAYLSPVQVETNENWRLVAGGYLHTIGVRTDGTLWTWGYNGAGQLGDGGTEDRWSPVQIGMNESWQVVDAGNAHTVAVRSNGTLWAWGGNGSGQLGVGVFVEVLGGAVWGPPP